MYTLVVLTTAKTVDELTRLYCYFAQKRLFKVNNTI